MRKLKDKSKKPVDVAQTPEQQSSPPAKKKDLSPELVKMEVTNEAGKLLLLHNQNPLGSATEAFLQLRKLTQVLRTRRAQNQDMHHI